MRYLTFLLLLGCFSIEIRMHIKQNERMDISMKYDLSRMMSLMVNVLGDTSFSNVAIDTTLIFKGLNYEEKLKKLEEVENLFAKIGIKTQKDSIQRDSLFVHYISEVHFEYKSTEQKTTLIYSVRLEDVPIVDLVNMKQFSESPYKLSVIETENEIEFYMEKPEDTQLLTDDLPIDGNYTFEVISELPIIYTNAIGRTENRMVWKYGFSEILKKPPKTKFIHFKLGR